MLINNVNRRSRDLDLSRDDQLPCRAVDQRDMHRGKEQYKGSLNPSRFPFSSPSLFLEQHHERIMKPSQVFLGIAAAGVQFAAAATPPASEPQVPNTLGLAFEKNIVQPGELIDQAGKFFSTTPSI